jgi:hypothetical protein
MREREEIVKDFNYAHEVVKVSDGIEKFKFDEGTRNNAAQALQLEVLLDIRGLLIGSQRPYPQGGFPR